MFFEKVNTLNIIFENKMENNALYGTSKLCNFFPVFYNKTNCKNKKFPFFTLKKLLKFNLSN